MNVNNWMILLGAGCLPLGGCISSNFDRSLGADREADDLDAGTSGVDNAPSDTGAEQPNAPVGGTSTTGPMPGADTSGSDTTLSPESEGDQSGPTDGDTGSAQASGEDTGGPLVPPDDERCVELEAASLSVLRDTCNSCHNPDANTGNFGDAVNVEAMLRSGVLVAGNPEGSRVFSRMENRTMPPPGTNPRPNAAETEIVRDWISSCLDDEASVVSPACGGEVISEFSMVRQMVDDITSIRSDDRQFARYFTVSHLHNSGICGEELDVYRAALSKTINSLSVDPRITRPEAIDSEETIFRIDIRDYGWDTVFGQDKWELLVASNPYAFERVGSDADTLKDLTGTDVPFQTGDWLSHGATVPPLYHDMLGIPDTLEGLEQQLGLNLGNNIFTREVVRSGFLESGVSTNNRVIERHEQPTSPDRYLWVSYDFANALENQNIFANPLDFQEDGGELIFSLANGLQAYMIINAAGGRLDEAPIAIVSDPVQPDRTVRNGISCMGCHSDGIKFKEDQIRSFVLSSLDFDADEKEIVEDIYAPSSVFAAYVEADATAFLRAEASTWPAIDADDEPIQYVFLDFELPVDLERAAAEFGITPNALLRSLGVLDPTFSSLAYGPIQRDTFEALFAQSVCRLNLGIANDIECGE